MKKIDVPFEIMCELQCTSHIAIAAWTKAKKENPEEHLPVDDENFDSADEGLSWVAWEDLWNALEKVAQYNPTKD